MFCPTCGAAAQPNQKFCVNCGTSLANASAPATPSAPTATVISTPENEPTGAWNVVEQTTPPASGGPWQAPVAAGGAWSVGTTGEVPTSTQFAVQSQAGYDHTGQMLAVPATQPFTVTPLVVAAAATALAILIALVTKLSTIEVQGAAGLPSEESKLTDVSNTAIALVLAAVVLVGGAAIGATGRRFGTGLAGGAGLAVAGFAGFQIGIVTQNFDLYTFLANQAGGSFTITFTREIGFFAIAAAGVLGVITFLLALSSNGPDGRPMLSSGPGTLGALGTLAVGIGPLIPMNGASFSSNFSDDAIPPITLYLRLLVLLLIVLAGVIGFTGRRRWGLGLALGGICIAVVQWFTTLTEQGDFPLGIAGANIGSLDGKPHVVTTIGIVVMLAAAAVSAILAAQSSGSSTAGDPMGVTV